MSRDAKASAICQNLKARYKDGSAKFATIAMAFAVILGTGCGDNRDSKELYHAVRSEKDPDKKQALEEELAERADGGDVWACAHSFAFPMGLMIGAIQPMENASEDWLLASESGRKAIQRLRCALPIDDEIESDLAITLQRIEPLVWTIEANLPQERRVALGRQYPLVRGAPDTGIIDGGWYCASDSSITDHRTFSLAGAYTRRAVLGKDDGDADIGEWTREGSKLTIAHLATRSRPQNPDLVRGWLRLTGDTAGVAELERTGFATLNNDRPRTYVYDIEVMDGSKLWLSRPFWPEARDGNSGPRHEERIACDRTNLWSQRTASPPATSQEGRSTSPPESAVGRPRQQLELAPEASLVGSQEIAGIVPPESTETPEAGLSVGSTEKGVHARQSAEELSQTLTSRTCEHTLKDTALWGEVTVALNMECALIDTDAKECRSFEVRFPNGSVTTSADLGIPMTGGRLDFHPWTIEAYDETVGGDTWDRWVVSLVEWGGGNRAEERYVVLDRDGGALSSPLNPSQWAKWRATRHIPDEALTFQGPMGVNKRCIDELVTGG